MSRMRYIAATTNQPIRFVGLSTALANAADLADWLGIGKKVLPLPLPWFRASLHAGRPFAIYKCARSPELITALITALLDMLFNEILDTHQCSSAFSTPAKLCDLATVLHMYAGVGAGGTSNGV